MDWDLFTVAIVIAIFHILAYWNYRGHINDIKESRTYWEKKWRFEAEESNRLRETIIRGIDQARDPTQYCLKCRQRIKGWGNECQQCSTTGVLN